MITEDNNIMYGVLKILVDKEQNIKELKDIANMNQKQFDSRFEFYKKHNIKNPGKIDFIMVQYHMNGGGRVYDKEVRVPENLYNRLRGIGMIRPDAENIGLVNGLNRPVAR